MARPIRINPVRIKVKQFDATTTVEDSDFREPKSEKVFESVKELKGQVNFGGKTYSEVWRTRTGDEGRTMGWCVFRTSDLEKWGVTLRKGDRIIEIAGEPMDLEIREVRFESPLRGKFLLVYAIFEHVKEKRASV